MQHFSPSLKWAALAGRLGGLLTTARRLLLLAGLAAAAPAAGQGTVVNGPSGSVSFGSKVTVLSNGNFVVADPGFSSNRGAVYLYDGTTGRKISTLTGTKSGDQAGSGGIVALANGNFVVSSPEWNGAGTANSGMGAVTWMDGTGSTTTTVSSGNSLVGSTAGDQVGNAGTGIAGVVALANGNYLVRSPNWQAGGTTSVGAVTWGNGQSTGGGVRGAVSAGNSLVGQYLYDNVGGDYQRGANTAGLVLLANSNYVVVVPGYHSNISQANLTFGAVTWGSGTAGVKGTIGSSNSLVGSTSGDQVGLLGITALPSGNYLVVSPNYSGSGTSRYGAVTWASGTAGIKGFISNSNSLVGGRRDDQVGSEGVLVLPNGNYLVISPSWSGSGGNTSIGAVTWGSGTAGLKGFISASNSLVGSTAGDGVGTDGNGTAVTVLPNSNYVVFSPYWDNRTGSPVTDAGALTLGDANGGTVGPITGCNSIVGNTANQGSTLSYSYNPVTNALLGGLPAENKVVIGVGAPAAPTGTANQQYTAGATVANLAATGTAIQWYAAANGGGPLASSTSLTNGNTYYATQTVNGCESLSRLAVRVADPLPVQLTAFTAAPAGPAAVRLAWATALEKNSQAFEVERSLGGTSFERIGTVAAAGSSSSPRRYELLDSQLPAGATQLYYRLRQVDRDGSVSYSPVRAVALKGAATGLSLYPNPLPGGATTLAGAQPGTVASVYDALGRFVTSATADAAGTAALTLPAGLPAGVYVVRASTQALRLTVE